MIPFSESKTAIGRVDSICESVIFIITIRGTERSIPIGHQSVPQNISDISITSGERLSLFPISFGSIKFQKNIWTHVRMIKRVIVYPNVASGTISENATGKKTAIIDPILGMKLSMKIKNAQNKKNSILNIKSINQDILAVAKLMIVFTKKYDLISDLIWSRAWKKVDFSPHVIRAIFRVNDLLSRSINKVKKNIIQALVTKLRVILII